MNTVRQYAIPEHGFPASLLGIPRRITFNLTWISENTSRKSGKRNADDPASVYLERQGHMIPAVRRTMLFPRKTAVFPVNGFAFLVR